MDSRDHSRQVLELVDSRYKAGLGKTKADIVVAVGGIVVVTIGGAQPVRVVVPGAATQNTGIDQVVSL